MRATQLGVQAHCLRSEISVDLDATLATLAGLGLCAFEMMYFPGCRGNWWGDFGAAADLPAAHIGASIRAAGLHCPGVMVTAKDLESDQAAATLDWARDLGCSRVILTSFAVASAPTPGDWTRAFEGLEIQASQVEAAGLEFVLHTQPDLWRPDGRCAGLDALFQWLEGRGRMLEFDPTGAIIHGADPLDFIRRCAGRLYAAHLRDGRTPREPVFYLPAEPLGTGAMPWPAVIQALGTSATQWYLLEMEMSERTQALAGVRASLAYLQKHHLVE